MVLAGVDATSSASGRRLQSSSGGPGAPSGAVILDAQATENDQRRVLNIHNGAVTIRNVVITGGYIAKGAGVMISGEHTHVTFERVTIANNRADTNEHGYGNVQVGAGVMMTQ